jgi:predicted secreted protein
MTLIKRNWSTAGGFALAILLGALMHGRAQSSNRDYPPVSNMYIVNQTLCIAPQAVDGNGTCKPVTVANGAMLMLQLPGTPATWSLVSVSPNLVPEGPVERIPNIGRLDGTSELFSWHFRAARTGDATLVMREFPPVVSTTPGGTFTFTFQIR